MNLYKKWTNMVVEYVKTKGERAFWEEYSTAEEKIYRDILANDVKGKYSFNVKELAEKVNTTPEFVMGFIDGINDSLVTALDLEKIEEDSNVDLDIDLELLYANMLEADADYLYTLPQWDAIYSQEKREEIKKEFKKSKTVVNENKIGRNDPCPCGSGKKYKKCCGKNL